MVLGKENWRLSCTIHRVTSPAWCPPSLDYELLGPSVKPPHPQRPAQSLRGGMSAQCVEGQEGGTEQLAGWGGTAPTHPALAALAWAAGGSEQSQGPRGEGLIKGLWTEQMLGENQGLQRAEASFSLQRD